MSKPLQLSDIDLAVRMYYERIELSCDDISRLFGNIAKSTVTALKKKAMEQMAKNKHEPWNPRCVNTADAYAAWGLDIADLERRRAKIMKLNGATMKEEKQ